MIIFQGAEIWEKQEGVMFRNPIAWTVSWLQIWEISVNHMETQSYQWWSPICSSSKPRNEEIESRTMVNTTNKEFSCEGTHRPACSIYDSKSNSHKSAVHVMAFDFSANAISAKSNQAYLIFTKEGDAVKVINLSETTRNTDNVRSEFYLAKNGTTLRFIWIMPADLGHQEF